MKKTSLILALIISAMSFSAYAAGDSLTDKGDKYVTIYRTNDWTSGETTTFAIANISGIKGSEKNITWNEITDRAISNPEIITYYNKGVVNENKKNKNGECEFNVILDDSGMYKCFLFDQNGNSDEFYINHIDETSQKNSADGIISACENADTAISDIKSILSNNTYDFGFTDDLYSNVTPGTNNNENNVAKYIYDYVCSDNFDKTSENYVDDLCGSVLRAFSLESINMGITSNIYDIEYAMGTKSLGLSDYEKKEYSDILNSKLLSKKYSSIEEYDKALVEIFTGITIQYNDGIDEMKSIINKFAKLSGIDTSKVTDSFCKSIAGSDDYYSLDALKEAAKRFVEPSNDKGSSSGGKKVGSSSGGGGSVFAPVTADDNFDTKNDTSGGVNIFDDVKKDHWANTYVETLYKEGVVSGKSTTEFKPEDKVTREEFVKLLVSALKLNTLGNDAPFADVDQNAWYAKYINIAYNSDIINGINDTTFGTGINISRQDIAVMAVNALKAIDYEFKDGGEIAFGDSAAIDAYAAEAVKLLYNSGILSGDGNNMFNPKQNATRAEAAKIIYMISRK